ncbi:hypothetical protein GJR88_03228 [Dietzia sp. DQ12-45-1b]|nr:hypothetical protein GJR88_03228 [Dietzia sp. DQ12-45-1b]
MRTSQRVTIGVAEDQDGHACAQQGVEAVSPWRRQPSSSSHHVAWGT